ncbi:hypothetical protein O181_113279 [Austropuccinia psidii MF-1]|uniref:Aspartic peptidase DDI1-type domain-containing protein n=1 Tax=Austropuccinia psidii MF-1 TaxID=1389203 RepID=A0A9Q3K5J9_9BASI|nr:hypothetical protein [Austropuccinia psidii MF-1]
MRRDKVMIQARDGGYIVPEMKVLKSYIEQELETVIISRDRAEDTNSHYELNHPHIDKTQAKKVQFEDDTMENALNQLKELNNKIKEQQRPRIQDQEEKKEIKDFIKQIKALTEAVLPQNKTGQVFKQENQTRYPKDSLPPFSQRHIPYTPTKTCQNHISNTIIVWRKDIKSINSTTFLKFQIRNGAYIEDEQKEEETTIISTKYKKTQQVQNEKQIPSQEPKGDHTENTQEPINKFNERKIVKEEKVDIQEIMAQIIKKVLKQKINLTIEQSLVMSPKFFNQLKNLSEEDKKFINSIDTKEIQNKLINHHLRNYEQPKLHYACPLGFMQVYLGEEGHEIMELVDMGSELNIIPEDSEIKAGLTTRCLNMDLRGIGGHCTSIVGLEEFTPITLVTGKERNIHLFVARGAVHTVLGRSFLADNSIRLDFSQQKGEIFS